MKRNHLRKNSLNWFKEFICPSNAEEKDSLLKHILDDIIENVDFYVKYFAEQERAETLKKLNEEPKKKKWWQKK